jgi:hypothetical protein
MPDKPGLSSQWYTAFLLAFKLLLHGGWEAPPVSISTLRGQFGARG